MPRQKWRGISIFGMTNPFEPPQKRAFDDDELALAIESAGDALAAMEVLESQAKARAEDAQAYVAWVRQMEADGSSEAKQALNNARRAQAGLPIQTEEEQEPVRDENSWQSLIPDWQERQEAQSRATSDAIEQAKIEAQAKADFEREAAIAAAIEETEREAERIREEAVARIREQAAERIAAEMAAAAEEQNRLELERQEAEALAAQEVVDEIIEEATEEAIEELLDEVEPEPVAAAGFATGSFDIVDSAEQSASEDSDDFDFLLSDGELPFAREPKSQEIYQPLSTIERRSKAISQLYTWSGLTVGIAPLLLAAFAAKLGLSFIEGFSAIAIGILVSAAIISVAAIAGKRSGLSTLILARAAFGVRGNYLAAIPLVLIKLAMGAAILYSAVGLFDGSITSAPALSDAVFTSPAQVSWQLLALAALLLLAGVLAVFGGKVLYWAQLVVGGIGAVAIIGFVVGTAGNLKTSELTYSSKPAYLAIVLASTVVATLFGSFWVTAVAEFTRKIPMRISGRMVSLYVGISTAVLPLIIAGYGLWAIKSNLTTDQIAKQKSLLNLVLTALPEWAANLMLYSAIATLLAWAASWMYATSVSFAAIGAKLRPLISQPVILVVSLLIAGFATKYLDLTFAAVVIFAWAGIFVGDVALRRIAYHEVSLARDYGFYRAWNVVNIIGFVLAVLLGLLFVDTSYFSAVVAFGNVGIYIAFGFALLFPVIFGRGRVAQQEAELLKIEARRNDLDDVEAVMVN